MSVAVEQMLSPASAALSPYAVLLQHQAKRRRGGCWGCWLGKQSDFAKRIRALMYYKPSNAGTFGQQKQSAGVVTAGIVQIVLCNGTAMVSGLRQRFPVAQFHGGHEFVMFPLRAGSQHWSFTVLSCCWSPGHKAEGWGRCLSARTFPGQLSGAQKVMVGEIPC